MTGNGALEVPTIEDKPPEPLRVTVEFEIENGGVVNIPMPEEVANPPDTVGDGPVPVKEIGPGPVPVAPIALEVEFSGNGGAEELDGVLDENPDEYGEEPVEMVDD